MMEFLTFYILQDDHTFFDTHIVVDIQFDSQWGKCGKFAVKDENAVSHVFGQVPVAAFNPRLMIA